MAEKFINAIPLVSENEVNDNIKIPVSTGGTKAAAVSVGQIKKHVKADILSQTITTDASKAPSSLAVHGKFEKQQKDINAVGARVDALEKGGGGGGANITVDKAVISGSGNAVSGGAVYNELQKKVSSANLATINGHRLDEGEHITIEGGTGGGGNSPYEQNAVLVKGNLIKEVVFDEIIGKGGVIQPVKGNAYAIFISVAGMKQIEITTSIPSIYKGAFYRLKDLSSFVEDIKLDSGGVVSQKIAVPQGANFVQISFTRDDIINGVAMIKEVGSTDMEGVLPRVKSFAPLSVSRIIENQYMNKDGGMTEFTGLHTSIYDVKNLEDVFLDGGSNINNPKVSYVWVKNDKGQIIWKFDNINNQNNFNKFHLFFPEGAAELWVLFTIKVLAAKEQSEINSEFSEQLDTVKKENETLKQNDVNTNNEIAGIKTRLTKVEGGGSSAGGVNLLNHWAGKKIVWMGASAPQGQTDESDSELVSGGFVKKPYPKLVGEMLGATVINTSLGGVGAEAAWNGAQWIARNSGSISLTLKECGSKGGYRSWEGIMKGNEDADLYVFDIDPNNANFEDVTSNFDFLNWEWKTQSNWDSAKGSVTDFASHRDSYQGALLYLIDKIRSKNTKARFCFVSEVTFLTQRWNEEQPCITASKKISSMCNIPHIDVHRRTQVMGWNRWNYYESQGHPRSAMHAIIAKIIAGELLRIA